MLKKSKVVTDYTQEQEYRNKLPQLLANVHRFRTLHEVHQGRCDSVRQNLENAERELEEWYKTFGKHQQTR